MSYKHKNGETPDHVDSDICTTTARDQHFGGTDDPIKKAPVDTVQLKTRIKGAAVKAEATSKYALALATDDYNRAGKGDYRSNGATDVAMDKSKAAYDSLMSKKDSLSDARKGNIPAKP